MHTYIDFYLKHVFASSCTSFIFCEIRVYIFLIDWKRDRTTHDKPTCDKTARGKTACGKTARGKRARGKLSRSETAKLQDVKATKYHGTKQQYLKTKQRGNDAHIVGDKYLNDWFITVNFLHLSKTIRALK